MHPIRKSIKIQVTKKEKQSRFLVSLISNKKQNDIPNENFLDDFQKKYNNKRSVNNKDFLKFTKPEKSFFVNFEEKYLKKWLFYPVVNFFIKIGYFFVYFIRIITHFFIIIFKPFALKLKIKKQNKKPFNSFFKSKEFINETRNYQLIPRSKKKGLLKMIIFNRNEIKKKNIKNENVKKVRNINIFKIFFALFPRFRLNMLKTSLLLALFLMILSLPLKSFSFYYDLKETKGKVLGVSEEAINNILLAGTQTKNMDFSEAQKSFLSAQNSFLEAKEEIKSLEVFFNFLSTVMPIGQAGLAGSVDEILEAGNLSAQIGEEISKTLNVFNEKDLNLKLIIEKFSDNFLVIEKLTKELNNRLPGINLKSLPEEYQSRFQELKQKADLIESAIKEINDIIEKVKIFLGFDYDKRYLLVFQNNTELRASGGFIGSFAIIDFCEGNIKNLEVPSGGSYDTEGGMNEKFLAPEALSLVNPYWHFWDANWWPDWPRSAKKLQFFLEKSSGPSVDGVISFTPTVLENFLKIFGPIDLGGEYNIQINSENFLDIVQTFSEMKPKSHPDYKENPYLNNTTIDAGAGDVGASVENLVSTQISEESANVKPKKIIGDLLRAIIQQFSNKLDKQLFLSLIKTAESSFSEKQVLLYFTDKVLQNKIEDYKWGGLVEESNYDYLEIVHTNIAGAKSDKRIKDQVVLESNVLSDGSIENTLTIKRIHNGLKSEKFSGQRNVDWLRVYVPFGAELLSSSGFLSPDEKYFSPVSDDATIDADVENGEGLAMTNIENGTKVYHELGKTVFANWLMVDAGKSTTIRLKYRLPFKFIPKKEFNNFSLKAIEYINKEANNLIPFSLLWQKQPGIVTMTMKYELSVDTNFKPVYTSDANINCNEKCDMRTDMFWAYIFEKI